MANKEIIINDQKNTIHRLQQECTEKTNAIISLGEQLKRKEQECEKIKNWVKGMMFYTDCSNWFERFTTAFEDWKNDLTSQLDQLKAENKHLSEKEEEARHYLEEAEKFKNCLSEIKEIAEAESYLSPQSTRLLVHKILQKISECEVLK